MNATPIVPVQMLSARPQHAAIMRLSTTLCDKCSLMAFEMRVSLTEMLWLCCAEGARLRPSSLQQRVDGVEESSTRRLVACMIYRRQRRLRLTCLTLELFFSS